jgi:hypothetical protein
MDRIDETLADLKLQEAPISAKLQINMELSGRSCHDTGTVSRRKKTLQMTINACSQPNSQKLLFSISMISQSVAFLRQMQWYEISQQRLQDNCQDRTGLHAG